MYLGRIVFRGTQHQGLHGPLIDEATFSECQAILDARGEDAAKRASNPPEYGLTGLLTCGRCERRMVGAAAHGRCARYRYYTCNRRQRYGKHACAAPRVQADGIEKVMEEAVMTTFFDAALIERVAARAQRRLEAARQQLREQLDAIKRDIGRTQASLDRYLRAFEAGTMPDEQCGPRVAELGQRLKELEARRAELEDETEQDKAPAPTAETLAEIRALLREAFVEGRPELKKVVFRALIEDIRIEGKYAVPTYRLPRSLVRNIGPLVDPGSQNTNPAATLRTGPIDLSEPGCRTGQRRDAGGHRVAKP